MPPAAILVVDDDPEVRELVSQTLQLAGHHVETADDGEAALAALERRAFDLVVSDIQMPRLDGIGLYREAVRRDARLTRRFIFVTGSALTQEAQDFARMTGLPLLPKPFSIDALRRLVQERL